MTSRARLEPDRRRLLRTLVALPLAPFVALSVSGCQPAGLADRQLVLSTLDDALQELERLSAAPALSSATAWNWTQTLTHCAQSIEYSMTGYPQPRSALFQQTLGATALALFTWRGRMTHDLGEAIPGAPALDAGAAVDQAQARLKKAVADFAQTTAPLQPHFAYGALDKAAYAQAHAMHLANHFSAFHPKG